MLIISGVEKSHGALSDKKEKEGLRAPLNMEKFSEGVEWWG